MNGDASNILTSRFVIIDFYVIFPVPCCILGWLRTRAIESHSPPLSRRRLEMKTGVQSITRSTEEDGSDLYVMYEPPGNPGGVCTIVSMGAEPSDTMAGAGGPDHFEVNVDTRLLVHSQPSTSSPTVAKLPRGMIVENLGCTEAEGRTWCHIADGDASGWAAGEFLVEAGGPVRAPRATPVTQDGSASHTVERVQFPRGASGTGERRFVTR